MSVANDIITEVGPHFLLYSGKHTIVCNEKEFRSDAVLRKLRKKLKGYAVLGSFDNAADAVSALESLMDDRTPFPERWIGMRYVRPSGLKQVHFWGGSYSQTYAVLDNEWRVVKQCERYEHPDKDQRLTAELDFISTLPIKAQALFPTVYKKELSISQVRYEMEYVPFPTFAELISSGEFDVTHLLNILTNIYDKLFDVLYTPRADQPKTVRATRYDNVIRKRLKEIHMNLAGNHCLHTFIEADEVSINGTRYPGLARTLLKAQQYLQDKHIPNTHNHGDLIFQDILVNPYSKDFRLIDGNGDSSGYMYDIAKTLLCLETKYDLIYRGNFSLKYDASHEAKAAFTISQSKHYDMLETIKIGFWDYLEDNENRFFGDLDEWQTTLRVLCGVQNIAIIMFHALHHEEYDRACAFLLSGIKLINDTITS